MELRWLAVLASVGAHALALAAVARAPATERPSSLNAPFDLTVVPRTLPPEALAPVPKITPRDRPLPEPDVRNKPPRRVASVVPPRPPTEAPAPAPTPTPPAPSGKSLSMRGLGGPAPAAPVKDPPWWRFGKPDGPPPAGQLTDAQLGGDIRPPDLPGPLYRTGVPGQAERLGERVVADGDGGYREDHITFKARVDRDGAVHFDDRANLQVDSVVPLPIAIIMGGHFDITDKLMMMHGEDPYRYEKAKFMERTRDERAAMSLGVRSERMSAAIARMPKYLEGIWRDERFPVAERKIAIYSLWEEVAVDGDDELVTTGAKIRREICSFIRRRLPAGTEAAYTRAELEALNSRRKCNARFDPYAD